MSLDNLLPVFFMALMGLAMLAYVALDGYDLGVGLLLPRATPSERDVMIGSIGPFWDANETWLVLGVGILLIAFPRAQGIVLSALYLPVTAMLIGLILRGVAFDFRIKAHADHKPFWNRAFFVGSLIASLAQGWMLGRYIMGFAEGWPYTLFAALIALALPTAYALLGASWLILKTEGDLQRRAVRWAQQAWLPVAIGLALISIATPLASETVRDKWFRLPELFALIPIPLASAVALCCLPLLLRGQRVLHELCWLPLALSHFVLLLGFFGLAYSLYPWVVMDQVTLWQAAAAPESLRFIAVGCVATVPVIIAYTIVVYRIFGGKAVAA